MRPLTTTDVEHLHTLLTQPGVRRYLLDNEVIPLERTRSFVDTSIASFAADGYGLWGATAKDSGALVGFCGFWRFHDPPQLELLYGVADDACGRGYATEMATAMIRHGFEILKFDRIEASADAPNTASIAVMERAGMTFWKRELDMVYYAISAPPGGCGILRGGS